MIVWCGRKDSVAPILPAPPLPPDSLFAMRRSGVRPPRLHQQKTRTEWASSALLAACCRTSFHATHPLTRPLRRPRARVTCPGGRKVTRPDTVKDPAKREFVIHGSCLLQARLGLLSGQRSRRSTALPPSSRRRMREFMCTQTRGFVAVHETGMARSCHCGFPAIVRLSMEERT